MSGIESTTNSSAVPDDPVTEKIVIPSPPPPVPSSPTATRVVPAPADLVPFDVSGEPDEWPARGPAKGIRVGWPVAVLLVLLIAGGGIWGGAALQRSQGSSSTSSLASTFASRFAATRTGGRSSFPGFGGTSSSAATTGTVTEITGSTLYVTNASGNLVEVTLTPSTTVTRNAKTTLSGLEPGDTVIVQGTKAKNGTVSAASVTATAEGVTSGFGGFGG
jgi:Domain of unknown function (DUF5666)